MNELDLTKQLAARAIASGVDEARAAKVAANLAPVLSCLRSIDEKTLQTVEPAPVFRPETLTPANGSA